MNHAPDTDTTAHRYFRPAEVAKIVYSMNRGFSFVFGENPPPDWNRLSQPAQLRWVSAVEEYRRGTTARQAYEAASGEPWSDLPRDDQIRLEMMQLLVTGLASVQR